MVENRSVDRSLSNHNVHGAGIIVLMKRPIKRLSYFETLGSAIRETTAILLNRFWVLTRNHPLIEEKSRKVCIIFYFRQLKLYSVAVSENGRMLWRSFRLGESRFFAVNVRHGTTVRRIPDQ